MGFEGWGYRFEGPVPLPKYLRAKPGVFIVWCVLDGTWDILEAGDADNVKNFLLSRNHLADHDASESYRIYFAASYLSNPEERIRLLKAIKDLSFIPCDMAALKGKTGLSEHSKLFKSRRAERKIGHIFSKIAKAPAIPRRLVNSLSERIKGLEKRKWH